MNDLLYSYIHDQKYQSILRASNHTAAYICPALRVLSFSLYFYKK